MSTLKERVQQAYQALPFETDGSKPAYSKLEKELELPHGSLSKAIKGTRKGFKKETLERMAIALQVDANWLIDGQTTTPPKPVEPQRIELTDRYFSRAQVIELARAQGVAERIIRALELEALESDSDPGRGYWIERLAELIRDDKKLANEIKHFVDTSKTDTTKPKL